MTAVSTRPSGGSGHNTVDHTKHVFMDVGFWGQFKGKPRTDFGIAYEQCVWLCSWMNFEGNKSAYDFSKYPQQIQGLVRGHPVLAQELADVPLTPSNQPFVFIPDLHLALHRLTCTDSFKYERNGTMVSLEHDLVQLLDAACAANAEIVQVGDCFEIWRTQMLMMRDHLDIGKLDSDRKGADSSAALVAKAYWNMGSEYLAYALAQRRIIPRDDPQYRVHKYEHLVRQGPAHACAGDRVTEADVKARGVKFEECEQVTTSIMDTYTELFDKNDAKRLRYEPIKGGRRMPFYWVRGNHDNMLANSLRKDKGYQISAGQPANTWSNWGTSNRIWVEQGHAHDKNNNDDAFDKKGMGYDWTEWSVISGFGETWGDLGVAEGAIPRTGQQVVADMRPAQEERMRNIFWNNPHVRLAVMGHTHEALLTTVERIEDQERFERVMRDGHA
jgi:UDP-2,3-diacylglucosamine pyrophosphatase LpxH